MNLLPGARLRAPLYAMSDQAGASGRDAGTQPDESGSAVPMTFEGLRDPEVIRRMLANVVGDFERLITGKSRDVLSQPANDGRWGMVEIIPHMRDWEAVNQERVARILNEWSPELDTPDDSLWAIEHDYAAQDPIRVFVEFKMMRARLVELVDGLDEALWSRPGHLEGVGNINLHWLLDNICEHDGHHLKQARDLLV